MNAARVSTAPTRHVITPVAGAPGQEATKVATPAAPPTPGKKMAGPSAAEVKKRADQVVHAQTVGVGVHAWPRKYLDETARIFGVPVQPGGLLC